MYSSPPNLPKQPQPPPSKTPSMPMQPALPPSPKVRVPKPPATPPPSWMSSSQLPLRSSRLRCHPPRRPRQLQLLRDRSRQKSWWRRPGHTVQRKVPALCLPFLFHHRCLKFPPRQRQRLLLGHLSVKKVYIDSWACALRTRWRRCKTIQMHRLIFTSILGSYRTPSAAVHWVVTLVCTEIKRVLALILQQCQAYNCIHFLYAACAQGRHRSVGFAAILRQALLTSIPQALVFVNHRGALNNWGHLCGIMRCADCSLYRSLSLEGQALRNRVADAISECFTIAVNSHPYVQIVPRYMPARPLLAVLLRSCACAAC